MRLHTATTSTAVALVLVFSVHAEPIPVGASRQLAARQAVSTASAVNASYAFNVYRPGYHFQPKSNWMNDPCGKYLLSFM
jgi:hypothetical protein